MMMMMMMVMVMMMMSRRSEKDHGESDTLSAAYAPEDAMQRKEEEIRCLKIDRLEAPDLLLLKNHRNGWCCPLTNILFGMG